MKASDYVYSQAFKMAISKGLPNREAETAGAMAVEEWKRRGRATDAAETAVKAMDKAFSKKMKRRA